MWTVQKILSKYKSTGAIFFRKSIVSGTPVWSSPKQEQVVAVAASVGRAKERKR
jgi:hypothetical protein